MAPWERFTLSNGLPELRVHASSAEVTGVSDSDQYRTHDNDQSYFTLHCFLEKWYHYFVTIFTWNKN